MAEDSELDANIEAAMLVLVAQRGEHASACPSEVARALSASSWRALMPQVRAVAQRLQQLGKLDISQGGVSVSGAGPLKGPIRIRRPRHS